MAGFAVASGRFRVKSGQYPAVAEGAQDTPRLRTPARSGATQPGFKRAFGDKADPPNYVGFRRDEVELHMQFQFEHEMGTIRLRFLVEEPDALFLEYRRGVECGSDGVRDTPRGDAGVALYDLDRNALTYYRDLTSAEKEPQAS